VNTLLEQSLWSSKSAAAATGGVCLVDWCADGVAINSKDVNPGDLFVAIKGPKFDGHDFVKDAFSAGASAAVVDHWPDLLGRDAPILEVTDTKLALEELACASRQRSNAKIIAVTGSVGKTSLKEALYLVLNEQGSCAVSLGNLNNHWGVPLSLSRMPANSEFGVFEIGMNHPGEITPLTKMVKPHIVIITNVELVHAEYFESLVNIADAKAEILVGLENNGICILNRDNDQFDRLHKAALSAGINTIVSFGMHAEAQARSISIKADCEGSNVDAIIGGKEFSYRIGNPGMHWVINSLSVLAAVDAAGGDVAKAAADLSNMKGLKGRGRVHSIDFAGGILVVVDESYNASPVSMRAAIKVLGKMLPEGRGRRIAVLGDMLELGSKTAAHHETLAHFLIKERVDLVFAAGPNMEILYNVLPSQMRGGLASNTKVLLDIVLSSIQPGDVIVVKGSAGSNTGFIVDALIDIGKPCEEVSKNHERTVNG
jgi:UDP-N-acetylmuramoyl-tripeptide--D-alanyl-D-alanine ligase